MGFRNVVIEATKFNRSVVEIVRRVRGLRDAVARLTHAADVDEVFLARLDLKLRIGSAAHDRVANKGDGDMGVSEETDGGVLVGEAGRRGEFVEDVAPALRLIERGVDDREIRGQSHVAKLA